MFKIHIALALPRPLRSTPALQVDRRLTRLICSRLAVVIQGDSIRWSGPENFGEWNYPSEMICYVVHMNLKRRDVLRAALTVGVAAGALTVQPASADGSNRDDRGKRRSQYQPNSVEVQTFYRVNRYPMT
jgi:hypothetical protein